MSITIDQEARQFKNLAVDIDKMSDRYRTENGYFTFPSPTLWTIEKNLFYLLRNSTKKDFNQKYIMRPDYLSFDEYATVVLSKLLMFVNGVTCIENFNLTTVVVPSFASIVEICSDNFPEKEPEKLIEVNF
jgi:hypothetical protein